MQEILPGLFHWTTRHPKIGIKVSSYFLPRERVLIDPLTPAEGLSWFEEHGEPSHILLTNRHHYRHAGHFAEAFGCTVWCNRAGLHEFTSGEIVEAFDPGDELPGGIVAHEVGALCPDETALHIPAVRAIAFADGVVRGGRGPLGFVPDWLMGDDPEGVKIGLKAAVVRLLELDFDHVLLVHGAPVIGRGKEALRRYAEGTP